MENKYYVDAKENKAFFFQLGGLQGKVLTLPLAGVQRLALGEEGVLGGLDGFQSSKIHFGILSPQTKVGLTRLLHGQDQALLLGNRSVQLRQVF